MLRLYFTVFLFLVTKLILAQEYLSIPFEVRGDRIFLKTLINNTECKLLFDTGAFTSSIDSTFNIKNNLNIKPSNSIVNIKIDSITTKSSFGVLDIRKYGGDLYDGIIGIKFFEEYLVEIDYDNNQLRLFPKDSPIINKFQKLPTEHHKNNMVTFGLFSTPVTIYVNDTDSISGSFLIDTGSSRNITIFEKYYPLLKESNLKHFYIEFFNASHHGFNKSSFYKIPKTKIFNQLLDSLVIDCSYGNNGDISKYCDGIIGGMFIKNFSLLIDYKNSQIYIKRKDKKSHFITEYISDGIGLKLKNTKEYEAIISSLIKDNQYNIKFGDTVLSINGEKPTDTSVFKQNKRIGEMNIYVIKRKNKIFKITTEVKKIL